MEETLLRLGGFKFPFELLPMVFERAQIALDLCDGLPQSEIHLEKDDACDQRDEGYKYHMFNKEMGTRPTS